MMQCEKMANFIQCFMDLTVRNIQQLGKCLHFDRLTRNDQRTGNLQEAINAFIFKIQCITLDHFNRLQQVLKLTWIIDFDGITMIAFGYDMKATFLRGNIHDIAHFRFDCSIGNMRNIRQLQTRHKSTGMVQFMQNNFLTT